MRPITVSSLAWSARQGSGVDWVVGRRRESGLGASGEGDSTMLVLAVVVVLGLSG